MILIAYKSVSSAKWDVSLSGCCDIPQMCSEKIYIYIDIDIYTSYKTSLPSVLHTHDTYTGG